MDASVRGAVSVSVSTLGLGLVPLPLPVPVPVRRRDGTDEHDSTYSARTQTDRTRPDRREDQSRWHVRFISYSYSRSRIFTSLHSRHLRAPPRTSAHLTAQRIEARAASSRARRKKKTESKDAGEKEEEWQGIIRWARQSMERQSRAEQRIALRARKKKPRGKERFGNQSTSGQSKGDAQLIRRGDVSAFGISIIVGIQRGKDRRHLLTLGHLFDAVVIEQDAQAGGGDAHGAANGGGGDAGLGGGGGDKGGTRAAEEVDGAVVRFRVGRAATGGRGGSGGGDGDDVRLDVEAGDGAVAGGRGRGVRGVDVGGVDRGE